MDLATFLVQGKGRDSVEGFQPAFQQSLGAMFAAAPPEIQAQLRIGSGYRSVDRQAQLYQQALQKYGSAEKARRWVAPPGHSQHNHGNAADLKYLAPAALKWAHENAGKFGLAFPMGHENWHIELAGARGRQHQDPGAVQVASNNPPSSGVSPALPQPFSSGGFSPFLLPDAGSPEPSLGGTTLASAFANYAPQIAEIPAQQEARAAAERARRQALFGDGGIADMFT